MRTATRAVGAGLYSLRASLAHWDPRRLRTRKPVGTNPPSPTMEVENMVEDTSPNGSAMRIIRLTSTALKRLRAVEITPNGNVVVVGGRNGAGKSSVLDSIVYALGGKAGICKVPVRKGEKKAEVVCDLGDIIVRRTFTAGGASGLTVENAQGARYSSPQAVLDALVGRLSFDPLEFSRMSKHEQAATLREMLGLNFDALDAERSAAYQDRTTVNREVKSLQARIDGAPLHKDVPSKEQSLSNIVSELDKARESNDVNGTLRAKLATTSAQVLDARRGYEEALVELKLRREAVVEQEASVKAMVTHGQELAGMVKEAERLVADLEDIDVAPIKARIESLEDDNRKARENAQRAEWVEEHKTRATYSDDLTERIDSIDREKAKTVEDAELPVEGLGFDAEDGTVTLDGLPFDQASSAGQLRVSVAMGISANPKLRVLLIRDGSLLDEDNLKMISEMAEENDVQVWIERVEDDEHCTVVIEDGEVRP